MPLECPFADPQVEHREVADDLISLGDTTPSYSLDPSISTHTTPPTPPLPKRPTAFSALANPSGGIQLGSNNPFRDTSATASRGRLDDEDEELQRAIRMSQEDQNMDDDDRRQERERSVRASGAPPPSPDPEEGEIIGTLFGPSNKEEDGRTAMVRLQVPSPTGPELQAVSDD
jgi:hypothetical protein